ncbi:queuosine precursor transporter [Citricoccus sp. K5]|uniref:queuosine precursor transporter n=1 Tax=Citricoccus sp. K5 TaxID=2653135 RepID=UPI0012EF378D|nr:queuosine precursor transporter [Citricoccus sp. K5]VXA90919.1 putative queuosine precursor transporter [Citricoccus sp. K5]
MNSSAPAPQHAPDRFAPTGTGLYAIFTAIMAVVLILSNLGASKGVTFGPIVTDGGFFLFPLAYIIGDVVSEVYGFKASRRAIVTTFALSVFAALCFWVIIALPGAEWYDGQDALVRTLAPVPLIVLASLLGFLVGQLANSWLMVRLKRRSGERLLFGRLAVSTLVGEFLDTLVFCSIAAGVIGITDLPTFLNYVLVGFVFKSVVEIVLSPVTIWVIGRVKRAEPAYATVPEA